MAGVLPNHDRIASLDALHHTAQVHVKNVVPVIERIRVDLTGETPMPALVNRGSIRLDCSTVSATARSNDG